MCMVCHLYVTNFYNAFLSDPYTDTSRWYTSLWS